MRSLVGLMLLVAVADDSRAQSFGDYLALLERYRLNPSEAIERLAAWSEDVARQQAVACLPKNRANDGGVSQCGARQRVTAAMLHTDLAGVLIDRVPARADEHTDIAEALVVTIGDLPEFAPRWYELVALINLSRSRAQVATVLAERAIRRYPRHARMYALRGTIVEVRVMTDTQDVRGLVLSRREVSARTERQLLAAMQDYQRALELAPTFAGARLRLGWVRLLNRGGSPARDLIRAREDATDDETRYLAELFLGTAHERDRKPADALAAYQRARRIGPSFQTACLALSHAESVRGSGTRAVAIGAECLRLTAVDDPWWGYRLGGYDLKMLEWLRMEAQRR